MNARLATAILLLGALGVGLTALFVRDSTVDVLVLAGEAGGASVGVGAVVALVLWALRRSSITSQLVVVSLGTVGAVAAGALVSAQTMFAAERPYAAMTLVLVSSGTASVLIGLSLSERVRGSTKAVRTRLSSTRLGESWSPGSRTTCAPRSLGSARSSRRSRTASSPAPPMCPRSTRGSEAKPTGSPRS